MGLGWQPQGSGIGARSEPLFIFRCKIVVFLQSSANSSGPRPCQRSTRFDLQSPTLAPNTFQLDFERQVCLGMELSGFQTGRGSTGVESMFGQPPGRFETKQFNFQTYLPLTDWALLRGRSKKHSQFRPSVSSFVGHAFDFVG